MTKEIEIEGFGAFADAIEGIYNRPAIPATTGASAGDVLTLGSDGPEWAAPSGGMSYSTTEQEAGTWIDGSTLYQITIDMGEDLSINANSWGISTISGAALNIDKIINVPIVQDTSYNFYGYLGASIESDAEKHISFLNPRGSATIFRYVTLIYTKTTV